VEVEAEFGVVQFNIGQGLIHSINRAVGMLMNIHGARQQQDPMEYYVICNSTQQSLCFGQVCRCSMIASYNVMYVNVDLYSVSLLKTLNLLCALKTLILLCAPLS